MKMADLKGLNLQRFTPDTHDLQIDEAWNPTVPAERREHIPIRVFNNGTCRTCIEDDPTEGAVFDPDYIKTTVLKVRTQNVSKNLACGEAAKILGCDAQDIAWTMALDGTVELHVDSKRHAEIGDALRVKMPGRAVSLKGK